MSVRYKFPPPIQCQALPFMRGLSCTNTTTPHTEYCQRCAPQQGMSVTAVPRLFIAAKVRHTSCRCICTRLVGTIQQGEQASHPWQLQCACGRVHPALRARHSPDGFVGVATAPLAHLRPRPPLGHVERPHADFDGPVPDRR